MPSLEPVADYLSNSTIHGLNYFGDRRRHWIERTFWIMTFTVSMVGCFFMVHKTYAKWQQSPIINTQEDKFTPISEIPFPAVTLCPATKIDNPDVNLTRTFGILRDFFWNKKRSGIELTGEIFKLSETVKRELNITDEDIRSTKAAALICGDAFNGETYVESVHSDLENSKIEDFFKTSRPLWEDIVEIYSYKRVFNVEDFPWVLTEEGVCYTFNSLGNFQIFTKDSIAADFRPFEIDNAGSDWSPEVGYKSNQSVPLRAFKSEAKDGLVLYLPQHAEGDPNTCPYETSRLKVIVHSPGEFPRVTQNYFSIPFAHEVSVSIKPVVMTTTADLAGYSTESRQCYYNNERSLKFFKFYSQNNCEQECHTNFTRVTSGCVKLSMPRDNDTFICDPEKFQSLYYSDYFFRLTRIDGLEAYIADIQLQFNLTSDQLKLIARPCECLPSCVSLDYELTIVQSEIASRGDIGFQSSLVQIHFKAASFMKLKRSELYGWTDFIANCGGILGLFMGVSILSIIEIFYHATLRLACNLNKSKVTDKVTTIHVTSHDPECQTVFEPEVIDWKKF